MTGLTRAQYFASQRTVMNRIGSNISRRSFLTLPGLLPLAVLDSAFPSLEHHFQYEYVVGTSMDLVVWTKDRYVAERACREVLDEISRLSRILNTRDPDSEISRLNTTGDRGGISREITEV